MNHQGPPEKEMLRPATARRIGWHGDTQLCTARRIGHWFIDSEWVTGSKAPNIAAEAAARNR